MVLLGVSAAVDIDLFGLMASVILAIALVPFGIQLIKAPTKPSQGRFRETSREALPRDALAFEFPRS